MQIKIIDWKAGIKNQYNTKTFAFKMKMSSGNDGLTIKLPEAKHTEVIHNFYFKIRTGSVKSR